MIIPSRLPLRLPLRWHETRLMLSVGARNQAPRSSSFSLTPHTHRCRFLSSAAITTDSWEDRFQRKHLLNAWGNNISPLIAKTAMNNSNANANVNVNAKLNPNQEKERNNLIVLDKSTRYVIQLLYDLSLNISYDWSNAERATTLRCHVALQQLSEVKIPQQQPSLLSGSIALRAYEILQGMELFYGQPADERMVLPHPNAATYLMVLRMFAKDPLSSPQLAQEVVERMQQRYDHLPGQLELQPNVVHWNQVLSAWAVSSTEEEKAFRAASLLQRLKDLDIVDASSYSHVLRACARSTLTAKAKKLGAEVAVKVYEDMKSRTDLEPTSYMYTFFLQACSYISDPGRRDKKSETAYIDCYTAGCVNSHVLVAFRSAASPELFRRTLNKRTDRLGDGDLSMPALLKRLPKSDYRNANSKNEFGW